MNIFIHGKPVGKGSMRSFPSKHTGKMIFINDNPKTKVWQNQIALTVKSEIQHGNIDFMTPTLNAVTVSAIFVLKRGKAVTRKDPTVKPDIDKLARTVLDALTGVVYKDDSQVCHLTLGKIYGAANALEGVFLFIKEEVDDEPQM